MRKIIGLILSVAIAFSVVSADSIDVFATNILRYYEFAPGQYCQFDLDTGEFCQYSGKATEVCVPSEIEGVPVKSVVGMTNNSSVRKIVIPEGVEKIGDLAFAYNPNLHTIELPGSLTYIGNDVVEGTAFYDNENNWADSGLYIGEYLLVPRDHMEGEMIVCRIREGTRIVAGRDAGDYGEGVCVDYLYIPDSVEYIGEAALTQFIYDWGNKLGNGAKNMKDYAGLCYIDKFLIGVPERMYGEYGTRNIVIKPGTEVIPEKIFWAKSYVKSVYTPESLKTIPRRAFGECDRMKKAILPFVEVIGDEAFSDCEDIEKVQLSENIREIGELAFTECDSLPTIEIFGGVKTIRKRAFSWCTSLNNIIIHEGVERIELGAFTGCTNLTDIYYTGSEESWDRIDKVVNNFENTWSDDYNCGISPNVRIHYNYVPDKIVYETENLVPETINEVTITGKGTAYGRYQVYDVHGNPADNMEVRYKLNGSLPITVRSDNNGYVLVSIGGIKSDTDYKITFSGKDIMPSEGVLKVKVKPLEFSAKYEAEFTQGGSIGVGVGAGMSIAAIEADASLGEVGMSGSIKRGLSVSQAYSGGKNKVSISTKMNLQGAISAKAGLFAGVTTDLGVNVKASAGDVSGEKSVGAFVGVTYEDEDFDINNKDDVEQMSKFALCAILDSMGHNVVARAVADKIDVDINAYESGNTASLGAGANLGVVGFKGDYGDAGVTLGGINAKSVWSNSKNAYKDGSVKYTSSLKTSMDAALFKFKLKTKGSNNISGGSSVLAPENISNDVKISATRNPQNILTKLSITGKESSSKNILWNKTSENKMFTVTFPEGSAVNITGKNAAAYAVSTGGKAFLDLEEWEYLTDDMLYSDEKALYNTSVEVKKGVDLGLSGSIKFLAELGAKLSVSGVESYEYNLENGLYEEGEVYVQAKNDIADEVKDKVLTIEELMDMAKTKMEEILAEVFEVVGDAVDGVIDAGKEKLEFIGEGVNAVIKKTVEDIEPASVFALRRYPDGEADTLKVTTVGNPCIISATDSNGEIIEEFAQKPKLTIYYTDEDLEKSGVENVEDIRLMRWDDDLCAYAIIDATLNKDEKSLSANISETGQYLLAYDNIPPVITDFSYNYDHSNPKLEAVITDTNKNGEFELWFDEEKVLGTEDFYDYYDSKTGAFEYPITNFESNYFTARIVVADQFGNSSEEYCWVGIPKNNLKVKSFAVSDIVAPDDEIRVAFEDEAEMQAVYLNVEYVKNNGETVVNHRVMEECYDYDTYETYYSSRIPEARAGADVVVWVDGYDYEGNHVQSEKKYVTTEEVSVNIEESLNGYIRVSCSNKADLNDAKIIAAVYSKSGALMDLRMSHVEEDVEFVGLPYGAKVKAYLWQGIKPLCKESERVVDKK